jgi:hypothetical protein
MPVYPGALSDTSFFSLERTTDKSYRLYRKIRPSLAATPAASVPGRRKNAEMDRKSNG